MPVRRKGPRRRGVYAPLTIRQILALIMGPPWGGEFENEAEARAAYERNADELEEIREENHVTFWFDEEGEHERH